MHRPPNKCHGKNESKAGRKKKVIKRGLFQGKSGSNKGQRIHQRWSTKVIQGSGKNRRVQRIKRFIHSGHKGGSFSSRNKAIRSAKSQKPQQGKKGKGAEADPFNKQGQVRRGGKGAKGQKAPLVSPHQCLTGGGQAKKGGGGVNKVRV